MKVTVAESKQQMGQLAADRAAELIREAITQRGRAHIIVATGASQFATLEHLVQVPEIRWDKVTLFHLDEYVGLPVTHPASFRLYLWQRFHAKLPLPVRAFHYLDAEQDPPAEAQRMGSILQQHPIDVALVGIGENGHLAFNDPPADFDTEEPYLVVDLDEACRRQQLGEGWFDSLDAVPAKAISMSVGQILKSRAIIVSVPDERKAEAVRQSVEGPVSNQAPASILQQHDQCELYLDPPAASLLSGQAAAG